MTGMYFIMEKYVEALVAVCFEEQNLDHIIKRKW